MDFILTIGPDLVIIPDAGSNDIKELKILAEQEIFVIILDHHELEIEFEDIPNNTVIINSQLLYSQEPGIIIIQKSSPGSSFYEYNIKTIGGT